MSWCRFSSDNWKSDVYIWDGSEGITICVATIRYKGYIPKLPSFNEVTIEEYVEAHKKQIKFIERCEREKIDHPLAGTITYHKTVKEAIDQLEYLQWEGFHVPEFVIEELSEYLKEE